MPNRDVGIVIGEANAIVGKSLPERNSRGDDNV